MCKDFLGGSAHSESRGEWTVYWQYIIPQSMSHFTNGTKDYTTKVSQDLEQKLYSAVTCHLDSPRRFDCLHSPMDFFSHFVPSSQMTPDRSAPDRFAPDRFALVRFALAKKASVRLASDRLAFIRNAPDRLALVRFAFESCAPVRLVLDNWAPESCALVRSAF